MICNNFSKFHTKTYFLKDMVNTMKNTEKELEAKISTLEQDQGVSLTIFSQIFEVTCFVPMISSHKTLIFQLSSSDKFAEGFNRLAEIKVLHEVRNIFLEQKCN